MWRAMGWLAVICLTVCGMVGCQSSTAGPNGLFSAAPTRVPPPTTSSYGKAAKYYPAANTATGARPATPSLTTGASNQELKTPPATTTTLPEPPPTEIVPAVHTGSDSRTNVSYSVAPATATTPLSTPAPSTMPLRWGIRN